MATEAIDYIQAVADMMPPCPECGSPAIYPADEAKDIYLRHERMRLDDPAYAKRVIGLQFLCASCEAVKMREQCEAEAREFAYAAYSNGHVPWNIRALTFAASDRQIEARNPKAWKLFRQATPLSKNLWIYGKPGRGKTHAAACIVNSHLHSKRTAMWLTGVELCEFSKDWHPEKLLKKYRAPYLLILEDLDKGDWTGKTLNQLYALMNARYNAHRRLIVTSNYLPSALQEIWAQLPIVRGNASLPITIWERMLPMEKPIMLDGQSIRRERAGVEPVEELEPKREEPTELF